MPRKENAPEPEGQSEPAKRRRIVNPSRPTGADTERFGVTLPRDLVNKIDIARRDLRMDRCAFSILIFTEATKKYVIQRKKDDELANSGQENSAA